jgi:hypothetical protein
MSPFWEKIIPKLVITKTKFWWRDVARRDIARRDVARHGATQKIHCSCKQASKTHFFFLQTVFCSLSCSSLQAITSKLIQTAKKTKAPPFAYVQPSCQLFPPENNQSPKICILLLRSECAQVADCNSIRKKTLL